MGICQSNISLILLFIETKTLCKNNTLSTKILSRIIEIMRTRVIKVKELTHKFHKFSQQENLVVFDKYAYTSFDRSSKNDPFSKLDHFNVEDATKLLNNECVKNSDTIIIKHLCFSLYDWPPKFKDKILIESLENLNFDVKFPPNITIGKVKSVTFSGIPTRNIPILDKKSVVVVSVRTYSEYDVSFLEIFPNLGSLSIFGFDSCSFASKSVPKLPSISNLTLDATQLVIDTTNLRSLHIQHSSIEKDFATFIGKQSRLITLSLMIIFKLFPIQMPSSLKHLFFEVYFNEEEEKEHYAYLGEQLSKLRLIKLLSCGKIKSLGKFDSSIIKDWGFNGVSNLSVGERKCLTIHYTFDFSLPLLNTQADECIIKTSKYDALLLVDDKIQKLTLEEKLKEPATKELPILTQIKELIINFEVTEKDSEILSKVFPQFTKEELREKGKTLG